MVAAGGAGLNINPRGRPGRAPVLVWFCLNSRNHAVASSSSSRRVAREKRKPRVRTNRRCPTERGGREPDDENESTTTRWVVSDQRAIVVVVVVDIDVDVLPMIVSRARHITACYRGRCTTELHRFFDALANTDSNDPRPTAVLKVRGCVNGTKCCPK